MSQSCSVSCLVACINQIGTAVGAVYDRPRCRKQRLSAVIDRRYSKTLVPKHPLQSTNPECHQLRSWNSLWPWVLTHKKFKKRIGPFSAESLASLSKRRRSQKFQ